LIIVEINVTGISTFQLIQPVLPYTQFIKIVFMVIPRDPAQLEILLMAASREYPAAYTSYYILMNNFTPGEKTNPQICPCPFKHLYVCGMAYQ
jgi:hypothetical protein